MTITDDVRVNTHIFFQPTLITVTLLSFYITTVELEQLREFVFNYSQAFIDNHSSRCN